MSQLPGFKGVSPKGIIHIEKDDNGIAGLEVEGCLSINNLFADQGKHLATGQNLLLECSDGELLQKDAPIYQLELTGRIFHHPEMDLIHLPIYTTSELPGFEFIVVDDGIPTLVTSPTKENLLHRDSLFQVPIESRTITVPLSIFIGINTNFVYGLPTKLFIIVNCWNTISSFDMEIPNTVTNINTSFNNIVEPIYQDLSSCDLEFNGTSFTNILSSYNGSTQGTIIFSKKNFDTLSSSKIIVPKVEGSSIYVLAHNTNVIAQRGES